MTPGADSRDMGGAIACRPVAARSRHFNPPAKPRSR